MVNLKTILAAGAIVIFQSTNFGYAMDRQMVSIAVEGTRMSVPFAINQPWSTAIAPLEQSWGPGKLIFAGKALNPSELIPHNIFRENLSGMTFLPVKIPTASYLENEGWKLLDSSVESDIMRGSVFMAYSQIKKAMEDNDWATAQRRFDRMGDDAKADPIAQVLERELNSH